MHRILLVEDEKILRDAYTILLSSQDDIEVDAAMNGLEALELCAQNTYDLILLDLMMPVLDGIGFLEKASLPQVSPQTKVVILSNLSFGEELIRARELGAHRHEVKSNLAPNDVIKMIREEL